MNRYRLALVIGVIACGIAAWIFAWQSGRVTSATLGIEIDASASSAELTGSAYPELTSLSDASGIGTSEHTLDKAKRDAMREAIYRAWGVEPPDERTNPASWPAGPSPDGASFGTEYVSQRIHDDYLPLMNDCYSEGLKKNPDLAGKLVIKIRIVGTKGTGGLVDWVDTASEDNTLDDKDMIECLKQSMYSVTFAPPPDDGAVTVTIPVRLASHPRDAG
jgi:hypothetical protein